MPHKIEDIIKREEREFFHTYKRLKIVVSRGEGCWLITDTGERILDMFGGLAVNVLGYNHPAINSAIEEQLKKYIHISNYFYQAEQLELASGLLELSGMKKTFLCNSGTEAAEAAIKLTRKYFKGSEKKTLVSFTGSFHGRTMGALSLTARARYREDFGPLLTNTVALPFNSAESLIEPINSSTAAVFLECIQGEGGVNPVTDEIVKELISLRNKYEFLIVTDEIQSGAGRTGRFCAYDHYRLIPDMVLLAKGIGGGLPLGAMLGNERVENVFSPGDHGTTFGGNPVASAAGIAVLNELQGGLMESVSMKGEYLISELKKIQSEFPDKIKEVRGKGLMIGIEMTDDGSHIADKMIEEKVFINCTNGNVIRLLPPLVITTEEISFFLERFRKVVGGI